MKKLLNRFRKGRPASPEGTDLASLPPLAHLVEPADPDPQMFDGIEALIDHEAPLPRPQTGRRTRGWRTFVLALFVGGLIGGFTSPFLQSQQQVVVQPQMASPWIPLGSVTLKGAALRSFVRAKCNGASHFFITMHGLYDRNSIETKDINPSLMREGEKIRIECIF